MNANVRGFTLIEALVVIAIVAILAAIGAPSLQSMLRNNRLSAAASAMQVSLNLARSEAVTRGANARVTVAANTTAGVWANGWTVFLDGTSTANGGVAPTANSASSCASSCVVLLEKAAALDASISYGTTGSIGYFTYTGTGRLVDASGADANRSFWFFDSNSDKYCLVISTSGRVRTQRVGSTENCATD
jgi:type IV fimbrial biogenesis protein FimT